MKRLLVFVYAFDETSQVFSHQVKVVLLLANHFDQIVVISPQIGIKEKLRYTSDPSSSERIIVLEGKFSRSAGFLSGLKNYIQLIRILRKFSFSSVFYFMTETSAVLFGLYFSLIQCRQVLWYAHAHKSVRLIIAAIFMNSICSSTKGSMPLKSSKVVLIGQLADPALFPFSPKDLSKDLTLIHYGRFDQSKNIRLLIQVLKRLLDQGVNSKLIIIGSPTTLESEQYQLTIRREFQELLNTDALTIAPAQPRAELISYLNRCDIFLHAFQGSLDKSIIESTLAGIPIATLNQEYLNNFGKWDNGEQWLQENDVAILSQEILAIKSMNKMDLRIELDRRFNIALQDHTLEKWVFKLLPLLEQKGR
jgi:glycosyltransferase involved in cell wall biosynthesis